MWFCTKSCAQYVITERITEIVCIITLPTWLVFTAIREGKMSTFDFVNCESLGKWNFWNGMETKSRNGDTM